jgi:hypothetical protein
MGYSNLRFQIIVRIIGIALTLYAGIAGRIQPHFLFCWCFTLVIVQVVVLIKHIDKTNQAIMDFFEAVKNNDLNACRSDEDTKMPTASTFVINSRW